jgi:hypothetical protein
MIVRKGLPFRRVLPVKSFPPGQEGWPFRAGVVEELNKRNKLNKLSKLNELNELSKLFDIIIRE